MDEEVRKLFVTPRPTVDVSLCEKCGKMTDNWFSGWAKEQKITWMCKKCRDKLSEQSRIVLENILEEMCDEENK